MRPSQTGKRSDFWQTPAPMVDRLRIVGTGEIAYDPCPGRVQFARINEPGDGLAAEWSVNAGGGLVYWNPPYSCKDEWIGKGIEECARGVTSIALLPASTDTRWFRRIRQHASSVAFWYGRVRYIDPMTGKSAKSTADHASALFLLTHDAHYKRRFAMAFGDVAWVVDR